jgi:hypothetical protein
MDVDFLRQRRRRPYHGQETWRYWPWDGGRLYTWRRQRRAALCKCGWTSSLDCLQLGHVELRRRKSVSVGKLAKPSRCRPGATYIHLCHDATANSPSGVFHHVPASVRVAVNISTDTGSAHLSQLQRAASTAARVLLTCWRQRRRSSPVRLALERWSDSANQRKRR